MDYDVTVVTARAAPTAVVRRSTTWDEFPKLWGDLLAEVWTVLRAAPGVAPGRNVMLYKDDVPNVEVGAEVGWPFQATGRVVPSNLPEGRAAMTISRGGPSAEGLAAAHAAVIHWCRANGHELAGSRWRSTATGATTRIPPSTRRRSTGS
jgi:hypothetical protein